MNLIVLKKEDGCAAEAKPESRGRFFLRGVSGSPRFFSHSGSCTIEKSSRRLS
uniref:Uncharacterized protein n=1 Tax=Utricularia reniformis TaxID=192314 RepID=A0A1Y0B2I7_9LAMI|nr:hypothetical protein AEK19_MT1417 [Utricularia reniformis]ART31611.1 hypothetical protein AEK19_MT1417 [Utricularia reniformis]